MLAKSVQSSSKTKCLRNTPGAILTGSNGSMIIEGVAGFGDELMLGQVQPTKLPKTVIDSVNKNYSSLFSIIGSARAEWAYDGSNTWLLQVQPEAALSEGTVIVPGNPEREVDFDVIEGLAGLRELVNLLVGQNIGIRVKGRVGVTSHIADVLRRHRIPSRIVLGDC